MMNKKKIRRARDPKIYIVEEAQIEHTLLQKVLCVQVAQLVQVAHLEKVVQLVPRQLLSRLQI